MLGLQSSANCPHLSFGSTLGLVIQVDQQHLSSVLQNHHRETVVARQNDVGQERDLAFWIEVSVVVKCPPQQGNRVVCWAEVECRWAGRLRWVGMCVGLFP